jgi:predicted GNAT family acetyltransferase
VVVKVERAECGDDARSMGQAFRHGDALTFHIYNRGKKSVALDLNSAAGREAFDGLVATTPTARRKGYGDATVRQALSVGVRATGLTRTVLHASDAGFPVYQRIGYRKVCTIQACRLAA